ncbi:MAG: carboxypeptidase-like regulatory domain-containing protein [Dictyoglomaceae bacterium]|nr:carboxypeptidase-like regulatory domain-containing protein [Dictyoglomaceae bacterium]
MKKYILILISLIFLGSLLSGCTTVQKLWQGNATILGVARFFDKVMGQHGGIKITLISQKVVVKPNQVPLDVAPLVKYTNGNGEYTFKDIPPGDYLVMAEDPKGEYYPASLVATVVEKEAKTVEDLVLTKAVKHVIIFREQESGWNYAGVPYTVIGDILSSEIGMTGGTGVNQFEYRSFRGGNPNLNLNIGDLVIIEGDQPQDFYDYYTANKDVFDNFVYNGGTIFWVASDCGWAEGNFTSTLPGGVTWRDNYEYYNDIVNFDHPITKNFPAQLYGNFASHGGFDNLFVGLPIANLMIYVKETNGQLPTYIEYRYGSGRVLSTTAPLEWYVVNGPTDMPAGFNTTYKDLFKLILVRSIRYIMNLPVNPEIPPSVAETPQAKELAPKAKEFSHK